MSSPKPASQYSRRSFLKHSAAGGVILGMSAASYRSVFGAAEGPSERVRVGMIGVGNQGGPKNNMKYFLNNIVAMCDLDKNYLAEADAFLKKEANLTAVLTDDYRKLLDAKDVDAVVVTVPDQWHAKMTIEACRAGKDVYCEKPLTLVIGEGRPMIDEARKHNRVVQTGTMQRSGDRVQDGRRPRAEGGLGKVTKINVTLPSPNWIARAGNAGAR
ncbi:MAG: Gfo/Idh/MocA family oxidoreductase [Pirellulales bacterium]